MAFLALVPAHGLIAGPQGSALTSWLIAGPQGSALTSWQPRVAAARSSQPVLRAPEPGDDEDDAWQPELELERMRLEGRILWTDEDDLSDPETWAAETDVLKARAERLAAAEERSRRHKRRDVIDAVGGLSMGACRRLNRQHFTQQPPGCLHAMTWTL
jgi:hypothetical protein